MPVFAKLIEVRRRAGGAVDVVVDGERFRWHVSPDVRTALTQGGMPSVRLTVFAERVLIDDDLRSAHEPVDGPG